ncbi:MAG: hypothetical protein ACLRWQ_22790 [Flavonifractor plautii]
MGERSKVYMTDLRCRPGVSLLNKLEKLMRTAGIGEIDFEHKLVAIKMHFGEPGNLAFLRPNYAKVVADVVKEPGRRPLPHRLQHALPGPAGKTPWSTWTQPMRTASPRCPPAAR